MNHFSAQESRRNKITKILKKANRLTKKRKLLFNIDDENDNYDKQAKRIKGNKCKRCRKTLHEGMLVC